MCKNVYNSQNMQKFLVDLNFHWYETNNSQVISERKTKQVLLLQQVAWSNQVQQVAS